MASRSPPSEPPQPVPQLYLITPPVGDAEAFAVPLAAVLDAAPVAAVLLRLAAGDERTLVNRIKALAPVVQKRNAALVIDGHANLAVRGGADGAHLTGLDGFNAFVDVLSPGRIVGCGGLHTRHDAMVVAERGTDYVMFGEPDDAGRRPGFDAILERIHWWAELFSPPCVGYAASPDEVAPLVRAGADFVAVGEWAFAASNPAGVVTDASRHLHAAAQTRAPDLEHDLDQDPAPDVAEAIE
jgi:thiamine-phosphate pyrophosphorylase